MKIPMTPGAESVPGANELFRRRSCVGIVADGALAASYGAVDAAPRGERVVAGKASLGVPLELGKGGIVRGVAGGALAAGHRLMEVPPFPSRRLPEIVVAGVACLPLVLHPQFPVVQKMASLAPVHHRRVEPVGAEDERGLSFFRLVGEALPSGSGKIIDANFLLSGLDEIPAGPQSGLSAQERSSRERGPLLSVYG
jgi:hypothetical protein